MLIHLTIFCVAESNITLPFSSKFVSISLLPSTVYNFILATYLSMPKSLYALGVIPKSMSLIEYP